jgi:putative DNA primase/helicase
MVTQPNTQNIWTELTNPQGGENHHTRFSTALAHRYTNQLLHVEGLGWHHWDGTRWAQDKGDKHTQRAIRETLKSFWHYAYDNDTIRKEIRASQKASGIKGIATLAQAEPLLTAELHELDADPYLLNVANGTLDLHTLELKPHNPADRITKVTNAAYHPDATSPEWNNFLQRVLPDPEVRAYLARFIGVSLIGEVLEQIFTIAYGEGANGKGVFYETILHTLGDYAHSTESDLFMTSKNNANAASPAIVALLGKRFIVASETEKGRKLAAALMKNLTGGDPITARALHRSPITFNPSHTTLMVTNHLPKVDTDPAVWRRIRVVPFNIKLPPHEWDTTLKHRLRLHTEAVLTWAINGLADYQQNGLNEPKAVQTATNQYQHESDAVARFIEAECITGPHFRVAISDLWEAWTKWSADDGAEPLSKNKLGEELDRRGYATTKSQSRRYRTGIALVTPDEEDT